MGQGGRPVSSHKALHHWHTTKDVLSPAQIRLGRSVLPILIDIMIAESRGFQDGQACKGSPGIGAGHNSPIVVQGAH
jgi:hypothetical protein